MSTRIENINYILKVDNTQTKETLRELSDNEIVMLKVKTQIRVDKKMRRGRPKKIKAKH